jgi:WD40 repeat protein
MSRSVRVLLLLVATIVIIGSIAHIVAVSPLKPAAEADKFAADWPAPDEDTIEYLKNIDLRTLRPKTPQPKAMPALGPTDAEGIPLPTGAVARFGKWYTYVRGTTGDRNLGPIDHVAFSPDGKTVATANCAGTLRLWDIATGMPRGRVREDQGSLLALAFTADGKQLTAVGSGWRSYRADAGPSCLRIQTWTVEGGHQVHEILHETTACAAAFSPRAETVATRDRFGVIRIFQLDTGKEISRIETDAARISALAYSADGKLLATIGDQASFQLWDIAARKELAQATIKGDPGSWLVFAPGGTQVIIASPRQTRVWDTLRNKLHARTFPLQANARGGQTTALSADGRTLATVDGHRVRLWEVASGELRRTLGKLPPERNLRVDVGPDPGHFYATSVAFAPDGRSLLVGNADATALLFDLVGLKKQNASKLSARALESLVQDVASHDAMEADDAMWRLTAVPNQAVPLLARSVRPAPEPDTKRIRQLIAELDSDRFAVRQQASEQLAKIEEAAETALHRVLEEKPSLEVRQRVERLLANLDGQTLSAQQLRELRTVEVLERIGTPSAQEILQGLAHGVPTARLTREAKASLNRLTVKQGERPGSARP